MVLPIQTQRKQEQPPRMINPKNRRLISSVVCLSCLKKGLGVSATPRTCGSKIAREQRSLGLLRSKKSVVLLITECHSPSRAIIAQLARISRIIDLARASEATQGTSEKDKTLW